MANGVYDGVRVLELATNIAAPYAAMFLADNGADVVKVEEASGDPYRAEAGFQTDQPEQTIGLVDSDDPDRLIAPGRRASSSINPAAARPYEPRTRRRHRHDAAVGRAWFTGERAGVDRHLARGHRNQLEPAVVRRGPGRCRRARSPNMAPACLARWPRHRLCSPGAAEERPRSMR